MSFKILRNNITKVPADAIVNTANPMPVVGRGTDTAVYEAAGWEKLLAARKEIGVIERGQSAWTPAFNLKKHGVKYIIHTIGVFYQDGNHGEKEILRSCYQTALKTAVELNCKSVAIPLLATGNYRFPKDLALQIAVDEISRFLLEHEVDVLLVVYDKESYKISEKLFDDVEDFLFDNLDGYDLNAAGAVNLEPVHYAEKEIAPIDVDAFRMSFLMTTARNVLLLCKSFRQKGDPERPVFSYHKVIRRNYVRSNFRRYNRATV